MSEENTDTADETGLDRRSFLRGSAASVAALTFGLSATETGAAQTSDRVESLIDEMTLEEKVAQVTGQDAFLEDTGYLPPNERLGIDEVRMSDGPLGLRRGQQTAFPATISAASTFDQRLVETEGTAIAREAVANNQDVHLAPALNIVRVPQLGRAFEYFGEDPAVTGELATAFIDGIQSEGIIATAKHYVANNQETNRGGPSQDLPGVSAEVSERALREIYLPGFRQAVEDGDVGAVMAAYNRINGTYATEHAKLLDEILKEEWGFDGLVMSDWGAVHSTVASANNGLDVETPGENPAFDLNWPAYWGDDLLEAVNDGYVNEAEIDDKVRRLLGQLARFDRLETRDAPDVSVDRRAQRRVARDVAERGAVLLKNEGDVLPFETDELDELAVIGQTPSRFRIGGGGSSDVVPERRVGPLEGIESFVGDDVTVTPVEASEHQPLDVSTVAHPETGDAGFRAAYFDNTSFDGEPVTTRSMRSNSLFAEDIETVSGVEPSEFSARLTGEWTAPVSGTVSFEVASSSASRLLIDGEQVVENQGGTLGGSASTTGDVSVEGGEAYDVTIEVAGTQYTDEPYLRVRIARPDENPLDLATEAAASADGAVVIAKGSSEEGEDREDLRLGGNQNELVEAVAEANDATAVVLNTGGPVVMPWIDAVPTVLQMWFPGQEGGGALANLLFGDANPAGRLPVTFGADLYDYPANEPDSDRRFPGENNHVYYDEGIYVGYRHFDDEAIEPLFPFGAGESYTSFAYRRATLSPGAVGDGQTASLSVDVANTGDVAGTETVQVYARDVQASVDRPPKELVAFQTVSLDPGERTTVSLEVTPDDLAFFHPDDEAWVTEPGRFELLVGHSSRDIRQTVTLNVIDRPDVANSAGNGRSGNSAGNGDNGNDRGGAGN
ncbi:glycoside hydrolase family 3 C-terminal domain-containing protein [Haloferax sp. KTX1]|uniref:glycoside hydrolase family 3 C-terminal domain-containing protein n=1 Tax=Haloferax sp. KTX1 TaxID=2600597 RepID=UPI001651B6DE|nr:glycoside hydrolase family 3 C-terminal domain-containing protein [Haloferax sp. KTX1]